MILAQSPDREAAEAKRRRRIPTREIEFSDDPTVAEPFEPIDDLLNRDPDGVFGGGR